MNKKNFYPIFFAIFAIIGCKPTQEYSSQLTVVDVDTVKMVRDRCQEANLSSVFFGGNEHVMIISRNADYCGNSQFGLQAVSPTHHYIHLDFGGTAKVDAGIRNDAATTARLGKLPGATYDHFRGSAEFMHEQVRKLNIPKGRNVTFIVSGHGANTENGHIMQTSDTGSFEGQQFDFQTNTSTHKFVKGLYEAGGITEANKANLIVSACKSGNAGKECIQDPFIASRTNSLMTSSTGEQDSFEGENGEKFLAHTVNALSNPSKIPDFNGNKVVDTEDLVKSGKLNFGVTHFNSESLKNPDLIPAEDIIQEPQRFELEGPVPLSTPLDTQKTP
jgi:hypothetical protein